MMVFPGDKRLLREAYIKALKESIARVWKRLVSLFKS
jgi:hypothetical protein